MTDVEALVRDANERFISDRIQIEQWVNTLMQRVSEIDPKDLVGVNIPSGKTAQELLPALYTQPYCKEAYLVQREALNNFQLEINKIGEVYNQRFWEIINESKC